MNTPEEIRQKIEKDLTIENPVYKKAIQMGKYTSENPFIILFDSEKSTYWFPRGYVFNLIKFLKEKKYPYKVIDKTLTLKPLNLKFNGKLRDYQEEAVEKISRYPVGVLEALTGSGKTVLCLNMLVKRQQPTLIIVHTKELLYQWQDRIKQFLKIDCGIVGDGKFDLKPITVGTIQTVKKKLDSLTNKFGFLIVDECHRHCSSAAIFSIQDFPAKYYLGVTATPFRSDGLGRIIFNSIGPKMHIISKKVLFETGAVLQPDIFRVYTNFRYYYADDYSRMITELAKDEERNRLICQKTLEDLQVYDDTILIISDRKKHVDLLQEMLLEYGIKAVSLTGSTNKKDRTENVEQIRAGKYKVVLATISLISEGFDLAHLTALFITTPIKFSGRLIQSVGRILRPNKEDKNKKPRIYDFRDDQVELLKYTGYSRDRVYKKEWG